MASVGLVVGVYAGRRRGAGKVEVGRAYLEAGCGVVGDAHAGEGDRQVSLVAIDDVRAASERLGVEAHPGDFAANLGVEGVDLVSLPIGTRLRVGRSMLELAHIGKDAVGPHHFSFHGVQLLVEKGAFCRVLQSGWVEVGDAVILIGPSP